MNRISNTQNIYLFEVQFFIFVHAQIRMQVVKPAKFQCLLKHHQMKNWLCTQEKVCWQAAKV